MKSMKHEPTEREAFTNLVDRVLSVSHEEIMRREAEYKKQTATIPRKRGRPPKVKPSVSDPASNCPSR